MVTRILQRVSRDQGWLSRFWKEQHKPGASRAKEISRRCYPDHKISAAIAKEKEAEMQGKARKGKGKET